MLDEFPLFCARDSTALARILSECRKYRLHLGLAHQTVTQLPNERLQGALENCKLKVVFGTGRQTAEALVKELFMPDLQAVKHEVQDATAQARTHPVFDPMLEQVERFTQLIQQLRHRHVLVKLPDHEHPYEVRVPMVPPALMRAGHLAILQQHLAKAVGLSCAVVETEIALRAQRQGVPVQVAQAPAVDTSDEAFWESG